MKLNPILRNSLQKIVRKIKSYIADYYVPLDEDKKVYWGCMPASIGDWDESDTNSPSHILHRTHYKGPIDNPGYTEIFKYSYNQSIPAEGGSIVGIGSHRAFVPGAKYKITLEPLEGYTVPDWAGEYFIEPKDVSSSDDSGRFGNSIYGGKLQIFCKSYESQYPDGCSFFIKGKDTWVTSNLDCSVKIEIDNAQELVCHNASIGTTKNEFTPYGKNYPIYPGKYLLPKEFYDITIGDTVYESIMMQKVTPKHQVINVNGYKYPAESDYVLCDSGDIGGENTFAIEYKESTGTFTSAVVKTAVTDTPFSIKCSGVQIIKYLDEYWLTGRLLPEGSGIDSVRLNRAFDAAGDNSVAEGKSVAVGENAHAEGQHTVASGNNSHSEGGNSYPISITLTRDSGSDYLVDGNQSNLQYCCIILDKAYFIGNVYYDDQTGKTTLSIYGLYKDGTFTTVVYGTVARGQSSHTEGYDCIAYGQNSHAEGRGTKAIDSQNHAEGYQTTANGMEAAHAEGTNTQATGSSGSHAEGSYTEASGSNGSHSEGSHTLAAGQSSHAEGIGTIARMAAEHASGMYNEEDSEAYELPYPEWISRQPYSAGDIVVRYGTDVYECIQDTTGTTWMDTRYWKKLYSIPSGLGKYAEVIGNGFSDGLRSNARRLDWHGNEELVGNLTVNGAIFGMKKPISTTVCNPDTYYCPTTALSTGDLELDETGFNGDYNYMFSGYFTNNDMQGMPQAVKNDDIVSPDTPASITWYGDSGLDAGAEYMFCCTKVASNKYVGVVTKLT